MFDFILAAAITFVVVTSLGRSCCRVSAADSESEAVGGDYADQYSEDNHTSQNYHGMPHLLCDSTDEIHRISFILMINISISVATDDNYTGNENELQSDDVTRKNSLRNCKVNCTCTLTFLGMIMNDSTISRNETIYVTSSGKVPSAILADPVNYRCYCCDSDQQETSADYNNSSQNYNYEILSNEIGSSLCIYSVLNSTADDAFRRSPKFDSDGNGSAGTWLNVLVELFVKVFRRLDRGSGNQSKEDAENDFNNSSRTDIPTDSDVYFLCNNIYTTKQINSSRKSIDNSYDRFCEKLTLTVSSCINSTKCHYYICVCYANNLHVASESGNLYLHCQNLTKKTSKLQSEPLNDVMFYVHTQSVANVVVPHNIIATNVDEAPSYNGVLTAAKRKYNEVLIAHHNASADLTENANRNSSNHDHDNRDLFINHTDSFYRGRFPSEFTINNGNKRDDDHLYLRETYNSNDNSNKPVNSSNDYGNVYAIHDHENVTAHCNVTHDNDAGVVTSLTMTSMIVAVIMSTFIVSIVLGNMLIVASVVIYREMRTLTNWMIVSLASADLLVAIVVLPISLQYELVGVWTLGVVACHFWVTADVFCCTASILNIVVIAIDRYWLITLNMRYTHGSLLPRRHACKLMGVLAWTVAAIISLAPLIMGWRPQDDPAIISGAGATVAAAPADTASSVADAFISTLSVAETTIAVFPAPADVVDDATAVVSAESATCQISQDYAYTIFSTFGAFWFPLFVIIVVYLRIFWISQSRLRRRMRQRELGGADSRRRRLKNVSDVNAERESSVMTSFCAIRCRLRHHDRQLARRAISLPVNTRDGGDFQTIPPVVVTPVTSPLTSQPPIKTVATDTGRRSNISEVMTAFPDGNIEEGGGESGGGSRSLRRRTAVANITYRKCQYRRMRNSARMLGLIIGGFVLCWLPFFLLATILPFCGDVLCHVPQGVTSVVTWLGYSNSLLNPIIYAIWDKNFRRCFVRLGVCDYRRSHPI